MTWHKDRQETRARLRGHIAAEGAARFLRGLSLAAAVVALLWKGIPAALALMGLAAVFHLARPGPSEDLDKRTGR